MGRHGSMKQEREQKEFQNPSAFEHSSSTRTELQAKEAYCFCQALWQKFLKTDLPSSSIPDSLSKKLWGGAQPSNLMSSTGDSDTEEPLFYTRVKQPEGYDLTTEWFQNIAKLFGFFKCSDSKIHCFVTYGLREREKVQFSYFNPFSKHLCQIEEEQL